MEGEIAGQVRRTHKTSLAQIWPSYSGAGDQEKAKEKSRSTQETGQAGHIPQTRGAFPRQCASLLH